MKYVKSLDGVRAIAILLVMLFHFYYTIEAGWIGVQLFFVLSGYLITTILVDTKELTFGKYIKRFYWRRILRIFPLYYWYILLVGVIYVVASIPAHFPRILPYLLTYSYNFFSIFEQFEIDLFFTHFWSLAIEEQFYLFWPFLIFFFNRKQLKYLLIGILIFSPVCRYFFADYLLHHSDYSPFEVGELTYRLTPGQFDSFAFGALIPVFNLKDRIRSGGKVLLWALLIFALVCGVNYWSLKSAGYELGPTSIGLPIGITENYQHIWSYTLIAMLSTAFILFLTNTDQSLRGFPLKMRKWLLENRIMIETGKISYGLYVYHWILLAPYRKFIHPKIQQHLLSFLLYFAIAFAVSYLSFVLFEKRFLKLKDKRFKL